VKTLEDIGGFKPWGISSSPIGERRRRGTGVALCSPQAWRRVAVSVGAVVPRARFAVWIGEGAAASVVLRRPGAPGRRRSPRDDGLYPPRPRLLPPGSPLACCS